MINISRTAKFQIICSLLLTFSSVIILYSQTKDSSLVQPVEDSIKILPLPVLDKTNEISFKYSDSSMGMKILRGAGLSTGYALIMGTTLVLLPEDISKWEVTDKLKWSSMKRHFIEAYTLPPVIDHDFWYINYIGHPYQGGFYFNNLRSQGAGFWTSSAYCLVQSVMWEYVAESIFERPSIQDLVTTPIGGVIVGELSHQATLKMRKNGFNLFEKILVCIINPSYPINNGFK